MTIHEILTTFAAGDLTAEEAEQLIRISPTRYSVQSGEVLDNPATTDWLKEAICQLEIRDPIHAERDAHILWDLAHQRLKEAFVSLARDGRLLLSLAKTPCLYRS
jgi:hypothetical protein